GFPVQPGALAAIAFRGLQDGSALLVGVDCALDACHDVRSYSRSGKGTEGGASAVQQLLDATSVLGRHRGAAIETTGAGCRLELEIVSAERLLAHDLSGAGAPEPLTGTAVGLGLGHVSSVL